MIVQDLFSKIPFAEILSLPKTNISGVVIDSNLVEPGDLFIPLVGSHYNGYRFVNQAIEKGAAAVAGDEIRSKRNHLSCINLPNAKRHLSYISAAIYGSPSKSLKTIGITGTNGKTTTAHIIEAMLRGMNNAKVGYVGAAAYRWAGSCQVSNLTTPFAPQLQNFLRKMVDAGVESAVLECSSHGIVQGRLDYTHFDVAVFTNLTHDHIDYHGSYVSYRNAKWKLFSNLLMDSEKRKKHAIFNIDDPTGRSWAREHLPLIEMVTYSLDANSNATVFMENFKQLDDGMEIKIRIQDQLLEIRTPMLGKFNIQNILAALSVAYVLKLDLVKAAKIVSGGVCVPGRLEKLPNTGDINVFIDFAHSENSLFSVLNVLQEIKKNRIITVFGCGGGSDRAKRSKMGKVVIENSDVMIATSDNPRNEDPEIILDHIFSGIDRAHFAQKEIYRITKREDAIAQALKMANKNDIVLIAGKGNEMFQEIKNIKHPFEDRKIVAEWMKQK